MVIHKFPEHNTAIAKDQPEYETLYAYATGDDSGTIICCWKLTLKERLMILFTGCVWHRVLTFFQPLQPQLLTVEKPAEIPTEKEVK